VEVMAYETYPDIIMTLPNRARVWGVSAIDEFALGGFYSRS
jgi:hypothetical protein